MANAFPDHLKRMGWTAIPFPSSEFRLLTLIWERNSARGHSNDFEFLAPGVTPHLMPPEKIDQIPNLSGTATKKTGIDLGVSILSGLIGALGGETLGLKAAFDDNSEVAFKYDDLEGIAISPVGLQMRLNSVPAPRHGLLADWLDDQLFVTAAVLFAKKISAEITDKDGRELGVDIPVLSNVVGAKIGMEVANESKSLIEFTSDRPVPIGLRLFAIDTVKNGGRRFLDLVSVKQGQKVRSFDLDASGSTSFGQDVVPFEPNKLDEDAPLSFTLGWDPE